MRESISRSQEVLMNMLVGQWIRKGFGFALVFTAVSASAWAFGRPTPAPEMDPGAATSAMALLGGGLAMIAGRRRNK
jgi:hypothetical protein